MHLIATYRPLVASIMLLATTQVQAALTSYTSNGVDVVYSSVSDVTWTKDANLLGTFFATQGFSTVVNNILAVSPTISNTPNGYSPTGTYTLNSFDFRSNGLVSWFGAMAFINYLNSINYGGSTQWRLPTIAIQTRDFDYNPVGNGSIAGDEYSELYYQELGSKGYRGANGNVQPDYGIKNTATFDNEQSNSYWSGTESVFNANRAWEFNNEYGYQGPGERNLHLYAWAVSPGQISAVPAPPAAWLFGSGLLGVAGFARRKIKPCN